MLRSGVIFGLGAPAAVLTLLAQPIVRDTADRWGGTMAAPVVAGTIVSAPLPGMRPAPLPGSPVRVAGVPRTESRPSPVATQTPEPAGSPALKPRRLVREGCETALSSLVGPEARRMTPGRCIS